MAPPPPAQISVIATMRESIVGRSIPYDLLGSDMVSRVVVYNGCNSCSKFEIPKDAVKAWGKSAFVIALSSEVSEVGVDVPGRRIEPGHPTYSVLAGVAPTILKVDRGVVTDVWLDGRTLEEFDSGSSL